MSSRRIFIENVKDLLNRKGLLLKDLSDGTGISPSHLSLVLKGKRSLSDNMKDKIAAYLRVSVSYLYSEEPELPKIQSSHSLIHDPERQEIRQAVDTFIVATHMEDLRRSFYVALGALNDTEARSVRRFVVEVLKDRRAVDVAERLECQVHLSTEEQRLLALYCIAGPGARLEWVKAISGLSDEAFERLTQDLRSRSLVRLVEGKTGVQASLTGVLSPSPRSLFTGEKLRSIYLTLAQAMRILPGSGPFFESNLAEVLLKAGKTRESIQHCEQAASLFEKASLFEDAADRWHRSALIWDMLCEPIRKSQATCEAIRCMVYAGNFEDAKAIAFSLLEELDNKGLSHLKGKLCLLIGHAFLRMHPQEALEWYGRGIPVTPVDSCDHGGLLNSFLTTLVDLRRIEEAENAAQALERWLSEAEVPREAKEYVANNHRLLRGILYYWKREWKPAKQKFIACLSSKVCSESQRITAMHNLGMLLYREGNLNKARQFLEEAIGNDSFAEFGANRANAYIELAKIHLRSGNLEPIARLLDASEDVLTNRPTPEGGWIWLIRAVVHAQRGLFREPVANAKRAIETFSQFGAEREEACACLWLARLLKDKSSSTWEYYYHRAYAIYEKQNWDVRELLEDTSLLEPQETSA